MTESKEVVVAEKENSCEGCDGNFCTAEFGAINCPGNE